jgi:predicted dehydrogenase
VSARLKLGLAGLGSMGRNHLRNIANHPDTILVAVSDPEPAALQAAVAQTQAQGFADPLEMIAKAHLDGVVVAAPTTYHLALAMAAIERGIPVLVEKPIAASVEDALAIVAAAGKRHVPVQVGHVERYNPAVIEMGRLLRGGALPAIYTVQSRRAGPFPARIRDVGVTIDLGTHDVDMLSWIVGERPTRVYAETAQRIHTEHEDLLFGLMHFPSGATGFLDVDWLTPAKRRNLVVVGDRGMFELDYLTQNLTFTSSNIERPELIGGYATTFSGNMARIDVTNVEPLKAQLDEFVRVLHGGGRPMVDAEDGLWAVRLANALLTAASEHRPIDLPVLHERVRKE